ncbi:hypothetical protein F1880_002872 [Penicillium rolfsii]|nr:hypothetical protein F1880_002872 [Penicillium rolfsii]
MAVNPLASARRTINPAPEKRPDRKRHRKHPVRGKAPGGLETWQSSAAHLSVTVQDLGTFGMSGVGGAHLLAGALGCGETRPVGAGS